MSDAQGLRARVTARRGRLVVDVDIDTGPGTLVVVGPNGAGKSTLLSILLGAVPVERGRIEVGGALLLDTTSSVDVLVEHRRLGYVPQDYALFPHMTVLQNVAFALESATPQLDRRDRSERASAILSDLKLDGLADRRTLHLSGGEKQRVALARALSVEPRALLLDEPLGALDIHARRDVRAFLAEYLAKLALPTVIVTHDAADARALGHRIAVVEFGRVIQLGTWEELASRPGSAFVRELVSQCP